MTFFRKGIALLISALLCLCLSGCGTDNAVSDDEITGDDWRTTGIVADSGRIVRNGEATDVLICVHKKDAVFYYDEKIQTVYGSVEYPTEVNDPWESYQSADFSDLNGDSNSDVSMTFLPSNGDKIIMTWLWSDEQADFIFNSELSSVTGK